MNDQTEIRLLQILMSMERCLKQIKASLGPLSRPSEIEQELTQASSSEDETSRD